ncbi:MAG: hypothetical protein NTY05_08125 [Rhodocyclales bacterium]|nr:hypothetical protein [Rhodocyclales bacterium]
MKYLLVLEILISALLVGCDNTQRWQEEVQLSTGETIVINREVKHRGGGVAWPQGQGSVPIEHLIRFQYPPGTGNIVEWRSSKFDLPSSTYAELPLVLDIGVDKTLFVFTKVHINEGCRRYVKYLFKGGAWSELPLPEVIAQHPANLFLAAGGVGINGLISLSEKEKENSSIGYMPDFKAVGPKRVICGY